MPSEMPIDSGDNEYFMQCIYEPHIVTDDVQSAWESVTRNFNISNAKLAMVLGSSYATGRAHTIMLVVNVPVPVRFFFYACEHKARGNFLDLQIHVKLPQQISVDSVCYPPAGEWRHEQLALPRLIEKMKEQRLAYRLAVCMATHPRLGRSSARGLSIDILQLIIGKVEKEEDAPVNAAIPFLVRAWNKEDDVEEAFFERCPLFKQAKALRNTTCADFDQALAGLHAFEQQGLDAA